MDLQVCAVPFVFAGVPGIVARRALLCAASDRDQRPVELDVGPALDFRALEHVGEVRRVRRDDVDGLVEVPVASRSGDRDVARCGVDEGRVLQAAQHQQRLILAARGALPGPTVDLLAVLPDPPHDGAEDGIGDIKGGTIGDHVGSWNGLESWSRPTSIPGPTPLPADTPPTRRFSDQRSIAQHGEPHPTRDPW
jgi:hypothetical protein